MALLAAASRAGAFCTQLAKARDVFPHTDRKPGSEKPGFSGDLDAFIAANPQHEAKLKTQMYNKVRKCACGKPNAYTLDTCNACGKSIADTPISTTPNVFMGFVYGLAKAGFPLTISIRKETPEYIVLDDLLALAPIHLNVIPTTVYIPDIRQLFARPAEALVIVNAMFSNCADVVREVIKDAEFRRKYFKNGDSITADTLLQNVIAGFNYPPSQYQLHLQFMVPPLTPFHFYNYLQGVHYTHKRFIPLPYMQQALALNQPMDITADTNIDGPWFVFSDIIDFFRKKGLDYDKVHADEYRKYGKSHMELCNWDPKDFEFAVVDGTAVIPLHGQSEQAPAVTDMQNQDKLILQNYGRPYGPDGKPSGSYYSFAKRVENVAAL